jgi:hypothetical protein
MRKQLLLGLTAGLFLLAGSPLLANSDTQQTPQRAVPGSIALQWEDLAPIVAGREVETVLADGTKLKGDVYAVREDHLVLNVKKTSNKAVYPKGQQSIERSLISSLDLRKKTIRWRVVATIAGSVVGLFAGGYVACLTDSIPLGLTTWIGIPIGLHVAARPVDVRITRIEVIP